MKILMLVLGIVVFLNGFGLVFVSNFNLGTILTLLLGICFVLFGVCYNWIVTKKGIFKFIRYAFVIGVVAELLLVGFVALYGQFDNVDYKEDAVIVLGSSVHGDKISIPLKQRLDTTVEYYQKNPDALIVVSGGQGAQESVTEAYAMEKYLVEHGVAAEKIIKEEKATSTYENMKFSKEILDDTLNGDYRIAVITNNFHIYRGVAYAKTEGFSHVSHMHSELMWYNLIPCYLRESLAIIKMWVIK